MNIEDIKSREEAKEFYYKNLKCDRSSKEAIKEVLKRYTKKQWQYLYFKIYNNKPSGGFDKDMIFFMIRNFYENLERAKNL